MQQQLTDLVLRLQDAFASSLVSVVLYGSAAANDRDESFSDLNILCVLKHVTPTELMHAEPVWNWWRAFGNPTPLLFTEEEVHQSADSFPLEFRDMQERRRILYGIDLVADLKVEHTFYRAVLERELRVNLFRLRQKAAVVLSDPEALLRLCADSVSTFCVLGRHLLLASAAQAPVKRREIVAQIASQLKIDMAPMNTLLDVREGAADAIEPAALFARYLKTIESLVRHADQL
ncbi:MAG: hypothetical protein ABI823_00575 [Bryobacteraceae bacterium]